MEIGSLTGEITLEDKATEVILQFSDKVKKFAEEMEGVSGAIAIGFGVVTAAVLATSASIVALGEKGSTLLGVETAFDHLAEAAGTTGDNLRGALSEGLKGTVDDMDAMQSVQRLLVSGFKLTDEQATTLAQTARELGKAFGKDAAEELDILSTSLATGRTRALTMQGVVIDVKKGEEEFAKSIGTTVDQLNAEGLLEGKRIAIMEGVKGKRDALGISELSFKEMVQNTNVALEEWGEKLAKSVASSPDVLRAYETMRDAVIKTFGGDSQDLMATMTGWINAFAKSVTEHGPAIVSTLGNVVDGIKGIYDFLLEHEDDIKTLAVGVAAYTAAWAALEIGGTIVTGVIAGIKAITLAAEILEAGSLVGLITPIGLVAAAVAGLAIAVYKFNQEMKNIQKPSTTGDLLASLKTEAGAKAMTIDEFNAKLAAKPQLEAGKTLTIPGIMAPGAGLPDNAQYVKDQAEKIEKATTDSIAKTEGLWDQYFITIDKMSGDTVGAQIGAIDRKREAEIASLDKTKKYNQDYQNQLQAIEAVAAVNRAAIFEDLYRKDVAAADQAVKDRLQLAYDEGIKEADLRKSGSDKVIDAWKKTQDDLVAINATGLDKQLLNINKSADDQIAVIKEMTDKEPGYTQAAVDNVNAIRQQQIDALYVDNAALQDNSAETLQAIADKAYTTYLAMAAAGGEYSEVTIKHFKEVADAAQRTASGIGKSLGSDLFDALKGVPQTLADAFKGGGSLLGAAESLGSQFGAIFGKHIGTAIGGALSIAGPIGAAIGSLVGPLIDMFAKLGGPSKDELAARSTFADFQKQFGTLPQTIDKVGAAYARMGLTGTDAQRDLQRALDATHVSAAAEASALDTINLVLEADKQRTADLASATQDVITAGQGFSGPLPDAIKVTIDQIMNASGATDAMKAALQGVLDKAKPDYEQLTKLAETYGPRSRTSGRSSSRRTSRGARRRSSTTSRPSRRRAATSAAC
jgi:hypothetical protein